MSWRTALKIAWREAVASRTRFLFVVLAIAAGVGALSGVRGFGQAFRTMLLRDARTLMAADLSVRTFELPDPAQETAMAELERRGVRRTWVSETVSMMFAEGASAPVLVSVKAIDPRVYPFYGAVQLEPAAALAQKLDAGSVAVSEDLLLRLNISTGQRVKLGEESFRVAAVVKVEPDRMTGSLNVGPRVMLSREALERTGLIRPGSRAAQRFLFRLSPGAPPVAEVSAELKKAFPRGLIADFRETHPMITRGLNRAERFLSLVSLVALIVGALGVGAAMHSHLQQRMDSIAVMKCLGAPSRQIIRVYLTQTVLVGAIGGTLGIGLGGLVQSVFPLLIARYFPIRPGPLWSWEATLEGLGVGLLTAVLFTLPPLLGIRRIRPAVILRRDVAQERLTLRARWIRSRSSWLTSLVILVGIAGIATWLAGGTWEESLRAGGFFVGGLAVSLLALAAVAWALLRLLRALLNKSARAFPSTLRHGLANLYRPGNQAPATLVALGVGVMFTLTVYLVQHGMLEQMLASAPRNMPNVFLINITEAERAGITDLLRRQPQIEGAPDLVASVTMRLAAIDGVPIENLAKEGWSRRFASPRSVTWQDVKPERTEVIEGAWWVSPAKPAEPQVCVADDAARTLRLHPGARLEWTGAGRRVAVRVACVWRTEEFRLGGNMDFIFSPGALDGLPVMYFAGARLRPASVAAFQKAAFQQFPTVTVINGADVLEIVQGVVDQVALVVRFVSLFAILAGAIILASSVAGTRFRRIREVAILKTLGASRRRVAAIFSIEFLVLGAVAGAMGALLAGGFSNLLLVRLLDGQFRFDAAPYVVAVVLTAGIANLAGWAASYRILGQKPLEVLRSE